MELRRPPDLPTPDAAPAAPAGRAEDASTRPRLRSVVAGLRTLARASADDRVSGLAAEVAFYGFLGIFPGLLALAAALGFVESVLGREVADRAQRVVSDFLSRFLDDGPSGTVAAVEALFDDADARLLSLATAGAVWSMWRATRAAMRALGMVYDAEEARSPLRTAALALGVALCSVTVAALMLAMFAVGPALGGGHALADAMGLGDLFATLWTWARVPVAFFVLLLWAATLFHLAPHQRSSFRADLPGALLTGVLWLAFSFGLQVYLEVAGEANQVLGVVGGVMTVLVWLYLLSLGLLLGGELNAVLARHAVGCGAGGRSERPPAKPR